MPKECGNSQPAALLHRPLTACAAFRLVEMTGFEPVTSWLQTTRSPS
jgi:hypothetical protein